MEDTNRILSALSGSISNMYVTNLLRAQIIHKESLRLRNRILSALSGFNRMRFFWKIVPAMLNTRSDRALVGCTEKSLRATLATLGKLFWCCFHHSRGFVRESAAGTEKMIKLLLNRILILHCGRLFFSNIGKSKKQKPSSEIAF